GSVGDNVTGDSGNARFPDANVRHMLLKEIQVLAAGTVDFDSGPQPVANGEVLNQEDPSSAHQLPRRTRRARARARARTTVRTAATSPAGSGTSPSADS